MRRVLILAMLAGCLMGSAGESLAQTCAPGTNCARQAKPTLPPCPGAWVPHAGGVACRCANGLFADQIGDAMVCPNPAADDARVRDRELRRQAEQARTHAERERREAEQRLHELRAQHARQEEAAERRRQQEQQDRAARAAEFDRQRQAAERLRRERESEEHRLAQLRTFTAQHAACRGYEMTACDVALGSPHASAKEKADLAAWRATALDLARHLRSCEAQDTTACDAALTSPALSVDGRTRVAGWRATASPWSQMLAYVTVQTLAASAWAADSTAALRALPTSTLISGSLAALLALALAVTLRRGHVTAAVSAQTSSAPPPARGARSGLSALMTSVATTYRRFARKARRVWIKTFAARKTPPATPSRAVSVIVNVPMVRDTPAAIAAMELAFAYIEEVRKDQTPGIEDHVERKQHLNTLALASKQLDAAQKLDPDAILEGQDDNEDYFRFSINELKAEALLFEGITHQIYDTKRAIPALIRATTVDPNNARAFHVLGLTHAANMNRAEAIAAFERAVALNPKNLDYRKELNRAQNLTAAEIAAYKATRAGEKIFDAGIKTANAGIRVYNVGVIFWNIFAFTWNIITFPMRLALRLLQLLRVI